MKSLWWKSAVIATVIGLVSHAAVMAIAQTVNAPYPSLLPPTNADKSAPAPMLGTKSAITPAAAPLPEFTASGVAKGSAACIAPGSLDTSLSHAAGLSDIAVCHA